MHLGKVKVERGDMQRGCAQVRCASDDDAGCRLRLLSTLFFLCSGVIIDGIHTMPRRAAVMRLSWAATTGVACMACHHLLQQPLYCEKRARLLPAAVFVAVDDDVLCNCARLLHALVSRLCSPFSAV